MHRKYLTNIIFAVTTKPHCLEKIINFISQTLFFLEKPYLGHFQYVTNVALAFVRATLLVDCTIIEAAGWELGMHKLAYLTDK